MLGDKYRMTFHRRLFAVIYGICRSNTFADEIFGMATDGIKPFLPDIAFIFFF